MGPPASATAPLPSFWALAPRGGLRGLALTIAMGLTAAWAFLDLAFTVTQVPMLLVVGSGVDVLRIGAWYAFLLLLTKRPSARHGRRGARGA